MSREPPQKQACDDRRVQNSGVNQWVRVKRRNLEFERVGLGLTRATPRVGLGVPRTESETENGGTRGGGS